MAAREDTSWKEELGQLGIVSLALFEEVQNEVESEDKEDDLHENEAAIKVREGCCCFVFQVAVVTEKADE